MIFTAGFVLNCQDPEAVLFSIILEEINCEIQDQEATDQELVVQKLLAEHQNLVDVFSQTNSDKLSLYCTIDYKIVLEQENLFRFSLLYYMLLAELKTVKEYLFDNLNKGFIVLSQALYTSSVLFVKKPNRGL
jgi:Fic family protein